MEKQNVIITINREAGTGGHEIAEKVSKLLDIKLYDKTILARILEEFKLTPEEAEKERFARVRKCAGSSDWEGLRAACSAAPAPSSGALTGGSVVPCMMPVIHWPIP